MRYLSTFIMVLVLVACDKSRIATTSGALVEDREFARSIEAKDPDTIEQLSPETYLNYVSDPKNGLFVVKRLNQLEFSVFYKPCEYVAMQNLLGEPFQKEKFLNELEDVKDMQYYTIKIACPNFSGELLKYNLKSMEEYEARVNYYSFQMQNDIKLIEGRDTLKCELFHFERNYGVAPGLSFVLGFNKPKSEIEIYNKVISIEDKVFNNGLVNIVVKKEDLKEVPALKLN
jgi:hypothetical protein